MFLAQSHRNKFWFGTEERMDWFPTPNRGGDFTGQSWGAGGTLLNGGGYQFNSFGSHGHFVFEWPGSSSREIAQRMLSYRNGTFGRGLIYFQDPLIFDTNVLPPFWADPSMGIGQEGMSLVYGVDPTPVPTSNSSVNDLPVTSAYYDLSAVDAGWRGKEDAVFIPIPEGYTLALGSFHSQTGTGRVFYREQAKHGALGNIADLEPIANNSDSVVNTFISGANLAGVWLYVGKSGAGAGSVTLTAMIGRLIESVKTVTTQVAQNLFTNPNLVGDGTWAEVARFTTGDTPPEMVQPEDFRIRDLGTGESVMEIERVAGLTGSYAIAGVSTRDGKPAVRIIPTGSYSSSAYILIPTTASSLTGTGTVSLDAPLQGTLGGDALSLDLGGGVNAAAPNLAGEHPLRVMGGESYSGFAAIYLVNGATLGNGDVWWTDIGLFAGDYDGPVFAGDTGTVAINGKNLRTQWDGDPNNSTSSAWTRTPDFDKLKLGPWIGGQGHSGCRFVGNPTHIKNTGVDGGQVGFAATFREVGHWVHG